MSAKTDALLNKAKEIVSPSEEIKQAMAAFEAVDGIKVSHKEFKELEKLVDEWKDTQEQAEQATGHGFKAGDKIVNIGKNKHSIKGEIIKPEEAYELTERDVKNEMLMKKIIRAIEVGVLDHGVN